MKLTITRPSRPLKQSLLRPTGTVLALWTMAVLALSGCLPWASGAPAADAHALPHWTYEGVDGPDHWGELHHDFLLCGKGYQQTPIDIAPRKVMKADWLLPLQLKFAPTKLDMVNNGHTIQVNYDRGSTFVFEKTTYELKQFHFHAPSEHKIAGEAAAMELHLVWSTPSGRLAVIGILLKEGTENPFLAKFWPVMPEKPGNVKRELDLNVQDALPADRGYYNYDGSLTTPPCAEGVTWIVMKQPAQVSQAQVSRFVGITGHNARPIQPINERIIKETL